MISDIINEVKIYSGEISVVRRKKNTLLEMNIKIKDKEIKVDMVKKLEECI